MQPIKIKKLHPDAIIPQYATAGAAAFDLHAVHDGPPDDLVEVTVGMPITFPTGLAFAIPPGFVMLIFSRSGHGFGHDTRLANCVGVVDSDYRGEVMVRLAKDIGLPRRMRVRNGDRIAQAMIVPIPTVEFEVVDELSPTVRGTGGFGSTGV